MNQDMIKVSLMVIKDFNDVYLTIEYISNIVELSKPSPKFEVTLSTFNAEPLYYSKLYSRFVENIIPSTATVGNVVSTLTPNSSARNLLFGH